VTVAKATRGDAGSVIFDALPDPVFLVDDGVIVDANDAADRAFAGGAPLEGITVTELLRDGEWSRLEVMEAQRARGWPVRQTCRLRFTERGGGTRMADVRWRSLPGHGLVVMARDVTDVTRAEAVMGRLAHLPSGLDGAGALLDASEAVFAELGWKVAFTEIIPEGSVTLRMVAPEHDPVGDYGRSLIGVRKPLSETPVMAEVLRTGEPLFLDNLPTTQKGPVGSAVALSDSMERGRVAPSVWCPIRVGTKVTHVLAVTGADLTAHDFVAIQLFSAQLAAAHRLQALRLEMVHRERFAAVGEMAAVLAHEVRNPLGAMFSALGTLARAEPGRSGEWRPLLAILQEEAERLQRLVTDLLDFARPTTAVLESTLLRPIVLDAVHAAQHDAAFGLAEPVVSVVVAEGLQVQTDRVLLRRVLVNILVNAFQHVRRRGAVRVDAVVTQSGVSLSVHNDGAPVPEVVATKVFEPFFTTEPRGTGLGLAIVRRVCTDIGAGVEILPDEKGATFLLRLPAVDA